MTVPLQLRLIPVISSDFNPSRKLGLAVDKFGLTVKKASLGQSEYNLYTVDSHVNFLSEPVSLFEYTTPGGLDRKVVTRESVHNFNHD